MKLNLHELDDYNIRQTPNVRHFHKPATIVAVVNHCETVCIIVMEDENSERVKKSLRLVLPDQPMAYNEKYVGTVLMKGGSRVVSVLEIETSA